MPVAETAEYFFVRLILRRTDAEPRPLMSLRSTLTSDAMVKVAALAASGGGFAFTFVLARFADARDYSEFIRQFSLASFLCFPFLYGYLPDLLRRQSGRRGGLALLQSRNDRLFLGTFAAAILVLLGVGPILTPSLSLGLPVLMALLLIGTSEAWLRACGAGAMVFHGRAFAVVISISGFALYSLLHIKMSATSALALRLAPPILLFAALILLLGGLRGATEHKRGETETGGTAIAQATVVALSGGVFQYAFLVVSQARMDASDFVPFSLLLTVSLTACLKIVEPALFKLYASTNLPDATAVVRLSMFAELVAVALALQIVVRFAFGTNINWVTVVAFSCAAPMAALAHVFHSMIYVVHRANAASVLLFLALLVSLCLYAVIPDFRFVNEIFYVATSMLYLVCAYGIHWAHVRQKAV